MAIEILREIATRRPLDHYLGLARNTPILPVNEQLAPQREHIQFGNNFYSLFWERRMKERDPDNPNNEQLFQIAKAERQGEIWQTFIAGHGVLIKQIDRVIDEELDPASELLNHDIELFNAGMLDERQQYNQEIEAIAGPMGINAYHRKAWNNLNPLLVEVAEQMKKNGINPEEFFS